MRPAPGWPGRRRARRRVRAWHPGPTGPSGRRRRPGRARRRVIRGRELGRPDGSGAGEGAGLGSWVLARGAVTRVAGRRVGPLAAVVAGGHLLPRRAPGGQGRRGLAVDGPAVPGARGEPHLHQAAGLELDVVVLVGHRLQVGDGRLLASGGVASACATGGRAIGDSHGDGSRASAGARASSDRDEQGGGERGPADGARWDPVMAILVRLLGSRPIAAPRDLPGAPVRGTDDRRQDVHHSPAASAPTARWSRSGPVRWAPVRSGAVAVSGAAGTGSTPGHARRRPGGHPQLERAGPARLERDGDPVDARVDLAHRHGPGSDAGLVDAQPRRRCPGSRRWSP